ncbi:MAG TPA: helix-turn-helix transcriptional regulator [Candidatus Elarobacter sp.]|jgi:transcriptional regulator with XRE-family HTH domain|nr:helix-turn-helix transcriptional regulator [Candidatus Elarobacter sp.]
MKQNLWRWGGKASIGRLLAEERERQGISQGALAKRLGVSAPNLSRIEHGADLRVSTLVDVARALGFEPVLIPKNTISAVRAVVDDATGERAVGSRFAVAHNDLRNDNVVVQRRNERLS